MSAKTIVIARAPEDGDELAEAIVARGFRPLAEPVLSIEYLHPPLPDIDEAVPLIFTSANGVKAFARHSGRRSNPVYTVGRNTADEARRAGFSSIQTAAGTVDDLVDILLKDCEGMTVEPLYVRGEEVSKDLIFLLAKGGIALRELTAYRSVPAQNLSLDLLKAVDARDIAAVLFFSSKGGRVFSELMEQYNRGPRMRTTKALCISEAVLKSVSVLPFSGSLIADTPDRYGMIKLLEHIKD